MRRQRELAAQALLASEARYANLVRNAHDGILVHAGGRFLFVNPAAQRILGAHRPGDLLGRSVLDFIHRDSQESAMERMARLESNSESVPIVEEKRIRLDGSVVEVEISATSIIFDGRRAIQVIMRDITDRKRTEEELRRSVLRLEATLEQVILSMARIVETRDPYTAAHQRQVAALGSAIATEMGLSVQQTRLIHLAAAVHDIGKVGIPAEILGRPGQIGQYERKIIETHCQAGHDILRTIDFPWPIAQIVLQHHERLDGSGYPRGLQADDTLLEARILAVADVVDAMVSYRPYRPALLLDSALAEITQHSGSLYDPKVVAACLRIFARQLRAATV